MNKYKVIDLFAGVGGLSCGFDRTGRFEIVMANEFDKDIAKAYSLNHPKVNVIQGDIRDITEDTLKAIANNGVDVIIGGPPCQSYSTLGKRQMDERAHLFEEYCRVLSIVQPKLFLFENVSGLLSMQGGTLIEVIKGEFRKLGYEVKCKVLNAANFGVPQFRDRVILVGMKGENVFEYPEGKFGDDDSFEFPYRTIEDAFSDLPVLNSGESCSEYATEPQNEYQRYLRENSTSLIDNEAPKNGEHLIRIMRALPDGGTKADLPEELRPKSGYGNTYAKMWWKKPAPTVTRNFATPSSSRCVHPRDSRAMTTREGARLQSFPDNYLFYGSVSTKNLEIGNAVPPLLSFELGKKVVEALEKNKK